jgi:histidinol-phosphate aminotransferase
VSAPAPRSTILEIEPYKPGRSTAPGFARPVKLSSNENALGCSAAARAAYLEAHRDIHRYPDSRATALREALARKHDLDPDRIVFGTGSDEIFAMACQAYLQSGEVMVQPEFAFAAWAIAARALGGVVRSAPETNFKVDIDAMLAAVDQRTRIMFVANPANPTGTALPHGELARLHAGLPANVLLVLDGAYAEFAPDAPTLAAFADAPNVLVTRTFSKLYGLAALRIGWAYAPRPVADALNRIRLPFNASGPAQAAAVAALGDDAFVAKSRAHALRGRANLERSLAALGLQPIPPAANFVTVRFPHGVRLSAEETCARLAERGILVRGLAPYGMADCFRVSVGLEEEMKQFGNAMGGLLG